MTAYCRQRQLALAAPGKLDYLDPLLWVHRDGRALVFTNDNATAYTVSRRFLVPVITHQTKIRERTARPRPPLDPTCPRMRPTALFP
ncbi:MAG: hypothetical protein WCI05_12415 [Myxococcales bacterium]